MKNIFSVAAIILFALLCGASPAFALEKNSLALDLVKITKLDDRLRVEIGGKFFTEYFFKDVPRPYCYPIIGPDDLPMTRNWPMKEAEGEEHDHPHHRSLWFAHGDVNGVDFWSEGTNSGKIVPEKFLEVSSGKKAGVIRSQNKWGTKDGKTICTDDRTIRFSGNADLKIIDYDITLHASNGDLKMGDTKEGAMAVRVAETMRVTQPKGSAKKGEGHIVNSEGVRDAETWGKRAKWVDYYGPVEGKTVGIAMFDHPQNPQFPTWWHVRDYGLFAANPYGVHDFEKKPAGAGDYTIPAGKSVTYRYRIIFHRGDEKQADVAKLFQEFIQGLVGARPSEKQGQGLAGARPSEKQGQGLAGARPSEKQGQGLAGARPSEKQSQGLAGARPSEKQGQGLAGARPSENDGGARPSEK